MIPIITIYDSEDETLDEASTSEDDTSKDGSNSDSMEDLCESCIASLHCMGIMFNEAL